MGGDYYERDVEVVAPNNVAGYSVAANQLLTQNKGLHKSMAPARFANQHLRSTHKNPIIFALDVTGSMGDWTKIIYDKLPMFYGQIMMQGYLEDPEISFCAVGDATCDDAPLQISDFGQGLQIDQLITKAYLEGGGGGGSQESYELAAYFYARHCDLINSDLPFFFITGDEHFYAKITSKIVNEVMSYKPAQQEIDSVEIWKELCKKFNVFHLHKPYFNNDDNQDILQQWKKALGEERILEMNTPKACIDVMLGAIALTSGKRTMQNYIEDMRDRGQTEGRIEEVSNALNGLTPRFFEINRVGGLNNNLGGNYFEEKKAEPNIPAKKEMKPENKQKLEEIKNEIEAELDEEHLAMKKKMIALKGIYKDKVPNEFYCPITQDILTDPVMLDDGNTYDRRAIEAWLKNHDTSPITNLKLKSKHMIPNLALKKLIKDYVENNKDVLKALGFN